MIVIMIIRGIKLLSIIVSVKNAVKGKLESIIR